MDIKITATLPNGTRVPLTTNNPNAFRDIIQACIKRQAIWDIDNRAGYKWVDSILQEVANKETV